MNNVDSGCGGEIRAGYVIAQQRPDRLPAHPNGRWAVRIHRIWGIGKKWRMGVVETAEDAVSGGAEVWLRVPTVARAEVVCCVDAGEIL